MEKMKQRGRLSFLLILCVFFSGCSGINHNVPATSSDLAVTAAEAYPRREAQGTAEEEYPAQADSTGEVQGSRQVAGIEKDKSVIECFAIPAYSNEPYVVLNQNVPDFSETDLFSTSFESYSALDSLGRCGVAYANIGRDLMPTEGRSSIGFVRPTGWHTVKYDIVDGKYLYNRCHLIGHQLTAENANERNLITGTRYLNVEGMLPFENKVADYIKETDNHVLYRATPVYEKNNLVASGVQLEAMSVEDKGKGVLFHVYCYNVQPGIEIDYTNGDSWIKGEKGTVLPFSENKKETTGKESDEDSDHLVDSELTYILNTKTKKFHVPACSGVKRMRGANKKEYTGSRKEVIAMGYAPCGRCRP